MKNKFNPDQERAVKWKDGPCLVLAGPGSGKTFVLTNRILNLIRNEKVDATNILVITFTRAAASEMKERFIKLANEEGYKLKNIPIFGTFHSVFFDILKNSFGYNSNSIITEKDEIQILFNILEKIDGLKITKELVINVNSDIKNYNTAREREERYIPKYISQKLFEKVYFEYQERLFNEKKIDFFGMIENCKNLLAEHKSEREKYQENFKYILIDEFQDINKSQYDLIKMLSKNRNLFVVGDDDQSIYGFRGSKPKVMKDFLSDYKNAKTIALNQNYRCAKKIVKFSRYVIDNNKGRFKKELVSKRDEIGTLEIKAFVDVKEENDYIIKKIKEYRLKGFKYSDIGILFRTNIIANSIAFAFDKYNIPYNIKSLDRNPFNNFAIKDIISYLKIAVGANDCETYLQVVNKPLRYISNDAVGRKNVSINSLIKYYNGKDYIMKHLMKFATDLQNLKKLITPLAIRYIRTQIGYEKYLIEHCKNNNICYDDICEILDSFEEEAIGHNNISEFISYIENYVDNKKKEIRNENADEISLMTFHLSKGLEFKVVFIIDANDGLIPHKKSIKDNDIETERRLLYVGMTRAKDNLHIFFTIRRFGKDFRPSRFILEAVGGKTK